MRRRYSNHASFILHIPLKLDEAEARRRFEKPIISGLERLKIAHRTFVDIVEGAECPVRVQIDLEQSEDSIEAFDVLIELDAPRETKVELEMNHGASTSMLLGELIDGDV